MDTVQKYLNVFGFDRLPDESTLRRRFKEAIFLCHPDRGGDTTESQRLIEAYKKLSEYVQQVTASAEEVTGRENQTFACQVVVGSFGSYALPIDRILSIEPVQKENYRRFVHRTAYEHKGNLFTLLTIRGRPSSGHGAYCIALFETRAGRFGLVIPDRIQYSDVTSFHFQEMVWNSSRDGSMKFYTSSGRSFEFPSFLSVT